MLRALQGLYRMPTRLCRGLKDKSLTRFSEDPNLIIALERAAQNYKGLPSRYREMLHDLPETELIKQIQADYTNFYDSESLNPYVPLAAQGPWVVTAHGAVLYDAGGYGMLGLGHNPEEVIDVLCTPQVQANIMTPNFKQLEFAEVIKHEIGHSRDFVCPYDSFMLLNSGSEANSLACRISDSHAKIMTDNSGPHAGRNTIFITLEKSFHGRTDRPASLSSNSSKQYQKHLKSYRQWTPVRTVRANDMEDLIHTFEQAERDNLHVELMALEPVAGEGNPGVHLTAEFYEKCRELTIKYHSLLLVDSVQAGIRTRGNLSVMDSDACHHSQAPDFETFSKALTGGQYPLSVLAVNERIKSFYQLGLYGNTMTTNPRGLEVAIAVLKSLTPELRHNIVDGGERFKLMLERVAKKYPDVVENVTGTGLLCAAHINPKYHVERHNGVEMLARYNGLGVIHGGVNALRFTPWFRLNQPEIELVEEILEETFEQVQGGKAHAPHV